MTISPMRLLWDYLLDTGFEAKPFDAYGLQSLQSSKVSVTFDHNVGRIEVALMGDIGRTNEVFDGEDTDPNAMAKYISVLGTHGYEAALDVHPY